MHEMTLAIGLMDIIKEELQAHQATRLLSVTVRCGALANVVPAALETAFAILTRDTPDMGQATLHIIAEELALSCGVCKQRFTPESGSPYAPCPYCGHEFFHDQLSSRDIILEQLQAE